MEAAMVESLVADIVALLFVQRLRSGVPQAGIRARRRWGRRRVELCR
jgi:hypothetical protein